MTDDKNFTTLQELRERLHGKRVLWLCSPGGHATELFSFSRGIAAHPDSVWVTTETPQTRSMLAGFNTAWVEYVRPRDVLGAFRIALRIREILRHADFDVCVSTGAAVAAVALPYLSRRISCIFIESFTRIDSPSLTGKIVAAFPGVTAFSQHSSWSAKWRSMESIPGGFVRGFRAAGQTGFNIVVALGTIQPYQFNRAVVAINSVVRAEDTVFWQTGVTEALNVRGEARETVDYDELRFRMREADVVIVHAGVGLTIDALESGKVPVLVVRSAKHHEHVDDHQQTLATHLVHTGVAEELSLSRPTREVLERAARSIPRRRST